MLAKENRLPRLALEDVKNSSQRVPSNHFVLLHKFYPDSLPRFGVIVSKKISKKATVRNNVKRVFYKILKDNLDNITSGVSGVFIVRASALDNLDTISSDILRSLKRAKMIK